MTSISIPAPSPFAGHPLPGEFLVGTGANTNSLLTNDLCVFVPIFLAAGEQFDAVAVSTITPGGAGSLLRAALLTSPRPESGPLDLWHDLGTLDATAVEADIWPTPGVLTWPTEGFLWVGIVPQGGGAPAPTVRSDTVNPQPVPFMSLSNAGILNTRAWTQVIAGAFPAVVTPSISNVSSPRVAVRGA